MLRRLDQDAVIRRTRRYQPVIIVASLILGAAAGTRALDRPCSIVALDLTTSVGNARTPDGQSEAQRNVNAVTQILATVRPGAEVTIIGITDKSFSAPYVLLSARVDSDEGYFKERIKAAQRMLVRVWQQRASGLSAHFSGSDVLGALVFAAQNFPHDCSQRSLVILSDMRQETPEIDLAAEDKLDIREDLDAIRRLRLLPDLKGVNVYALGVDNAGRSVAYWQHLRDFWAAYFEAAGANLNRYSVSGDLPR